MSKREELLSKLDKLYAETKSKNFVNHLIKAYCSVNNINKQLVKLNTVTTCSLTNKKIVSFNEVQGSAISDDIKVKLDSPLRNVLKDTDVTPFTNEYDGKVLGFTANETTTFLSYEAVSALLEWIDKKAKDGDKYIRWVVNQSKPKKTILELRGYKKPTTTMGELTSLQRLKAEFERKGL